MANTAGDTGSEPTVTNVEGLAEYQEIKNEHYTPFNLGPEQPAQNQFCSDKDIYPEWPALFSTQGTRFQKRAAPGPIDWASLKGHLTFDDHPHAVKVIAARFRKDFPLECKAIDESSWERLPYYFDDLDLYHWGPKFLRQVIQCICEEKSKLHVNVLRFAVHLIATDAPRARQIAYFGRANWYHEEVTHCGAEFLEEVTKFMTHRDDVIQKLTECANKYIEEAQGDSYMRHMYYDESFQKLNKARAIRLRHSAFKGPVLQHYIPPPLAPSWTARLTSSDDEKVVDTSVPFSAIEEKPGEFRQSSRSDEKSLHHRRTSSLGNGDITLRHQARDASLAEAENHDSAKGRVSHSFNADSRSSGQILAGDPIHQEAIIQESHKTDDCILTDQAMSSRSGNQKSLSGQHQSKYLHQKQPGSQKLESRKPVVESHKPAMNLKQDSNTIVSGAANNTRNATQDPRFSTAKPSKGRKKNNNNKRKEFGFKNEARIFSSPATFPETSSHHARNSSASRSIFNEDDSIISVTLEGEKHVSPTLSQRAPESVHVTQPHGYVQQYRTGSGSSAGGYQPSMASWIEPQSKPSGDIYAHEPLTYGSYQWHQGSMDSQFQSTSMPYTTAQHSEIPYGTEYQTQWAPVYAQPPMHAVEPSGHVTGAHFHDPNPPFANQGYQQQYFNPQAGPFQSHNHSLQHYQRDSYYNQRENRKQYPENLRYNYDRFPNRRYNNPRGGGYRRDFSSNTSATYGAPYDRPTPRSFQPGRGNSSNFGDYNRVEARGINEPNYRNINEDRGQTVSESANVEVNTSTGPETTPNIKYPILYPAAQPLHNTPVVSVSPKGAPNETIHSVDLDAVNAGLETQSKDILSLETTQSAPSNIPSSIPASPKETTTVVTIPAGRRSPSSLLPSQDFRVPQRNVPSHEDPYKLYVSGPGLENAQLAKIFEPYQPEHITTARESKRWQWDSTGPLPTNFAFVTFDSVEKCAAVKQALSGEVREGIQLNVNSAMTRFEDNFMKPQVPKSVGYSANRRANTKKSSNTAAGHVSSQQMHDTKTDTDTDSKHKKSFSTNLDKTTTLDDHALANTAEPSIKSTKASRKKGSARSATASPKSMGQSPVPSPVQSKFITEDSHKIVLAEESEGKKRHSAEPTEQIETTTRAPKPTKTGLQVAIIPENDQSEDKHVIVQDPDTVSPATSDHPPVASRLKKDKHKQSKKNKRRLKDVSVAKIQDALLSSASSEFPLNVDDSAASSFATSLKDNDIPPQENEAVPKGTPQNVTTQPADAEPEVDTMIWESTGHESDSNARENVAVAENLVVQVPTESFEPDVVDLSNTPTSEGTIDVAFGDSQAIDLEYPFILSNASDEGIGHEEAGHLIFTNPRLHFLSSSSSDHGMAWIDNQEFVTYEGLIKDGEDIERLVDQYPDPPLAQDQGDVQEQSVSIESSHMAPVLAAQDAAKVDSDGMTEGVTVSDSPTTSPVESTVMDTKTSEAGDDTQGWNASVKVNDRSNRNAQKKRRKNKRSSLNTSASDGQAQAREAADKDNQQASRDSTNVNTRESSPSTTKNQGSA